MSDGTDTTTRGNPEEQVYKLYAELHGRSRLEGIAGGVESPRHVPPAIALRRLPDGFSFLTVLIHASPAFTLIFT